MAPVEQSQALAETDDEINDNVDGVHGDGGRFPDELDDRRSWSDKADGTAVNWGMQNWSKELHVREDAETCATDTPAAAAAAVAAQRVAAASATAAAAGASNAVYAYWFASTLLNYKQRLLVDIVVDHAHSVDAYRLAEHRVPPGSGVQDWPRPLRIILTGTGGTGNTFVINEIVRLLGGRTIFFWRPPETRPSPSADR